jgi:hypothetical protein
MSIAAFVVAAVAAAVPPADARIGCAERAEPSPAPGALPGVVAELPEGGEFVILTVSPTPSRTRMGRRTVWLWKTPATLSADRSIVLEVPRRGARRARLGWGRTRSFAGAPRTTRFTACAEDEPLHSGDGVVGPRTGWGGALITLRRRSCLRLVVRSDGESLPLRVPLGRRCA